MSSQGSNVCRLGGYYIIRKETAADGSCDLNFDLTFVLNMSSTYHLQYILSANFVGKDNNTGPIIDTFCIMSL